jgi:hypothetical protein
VFAEVAALDAGLLRLGDIEALRALLARLPDGGRSGDGAAPAGRARGVHGGDQPGAAGRGCGPARTPSWGTART